MKNKNLISFVHSLVLLPLMTMSFSLNDIKNVDNTQNILAQKINIEAKGLFTPNQVDELKASKEMIFKARAEAIDAYFSSKEMPLSGMGMKMVIEADKNEIDWRLLPAISVRESTGGKNACQKAKYNSFGWGSCKIGFESNEKAIEVIARNLGGNNPKTAHHYDEKSTREILNAYNPPSIVPKYTDQVISIMNTIGSEELGLESTNS